MASGARNHLAEETVNNGKFIVRRWRRRRRSGGGWRAAVRAVAEKDGVGLYRADKRATGTNRPEKSQRQGHHLDLGPQSFRS